MAGSLFIIQNGSFYELRDQSNELVQTSTDAGVLANAALSLYPNGGCSLVFGPGTFNCSRITINQSYTTIQGSGPSTIIQPVGNNSVFYFTSPTINGIDHIRVENLACNDSGLMISSSAFFYFNAVAGSNNIITHSEIRDIWFSGSINRGFYDGGGTGSYLTGILEHIRFYDINTMDAVTCTNAFFSIMNLRSGIFSQGGFSLVFTNNSPFISLGVGTDSTIACLTTFEDLQVFVGPAGYSGTAVVLNNVNGVHFDEVAIRLGAPPNTSSTGLSIAGSLGEMVFDRLTIYSANVGILFTSSSDIGFTYLANGSVFANCGIMRCNISMKAVSDSSTKYFIGGQLLPNSGGTNFSPNPLSGTIQLFDVQGVDPIGVSTITVGASPFTYTNSDGVREAVYITGGAVTGVTKNGVALGVLTTVVLDPGEQIIVSYSSKPNMFKDQKG